MLEDTIGHGTAEVPDPTSKNPSVPLPLGLEALYSVCHALYPNQPNPLQVTALVKYWLGGPDPLDYVSMYLNPGNTDLEIPPHWHYVSFGLSDLHGDGRVHESSSPGEPSGFGFELTMRVKCEEGERSPPTWPAALMQALAKYVFQSDTTFYAGDHISWHNALDRSESRVQHMLVAEDPQLRCQTTSLGNVSFVEIVGVTSEELEAAQHWNGSGVLNIMKRFPQTGGEWHVTDMRRGESIFDHDPSITQEVEEGIESEGSNLSGVSARISWATYPLQDQTLANLSPPSFCGDGGVSSPTVTFGQRQEIKSALCKGLRSTNSAGGEDLDGQISASERGLPVVESLDKRNDTLKSYTEDAGEMFTAQKLPSLHLSINFESGALLPLALRGRLKHGRHFTFKSLVGAGAVTFLTPAVEGAFVDAAAPFAVKGPWLQVLVDEDLLDRMSADLSRLSKHEPTKLPLMYEWRDKRLRITVCSEDP